MSSIAEVTEKDGHAMLLIELKPGQRTFKFYDTQHECLLNLVGMFEETSDGLEMRDFLKWLDDFYQLRMFIMDTNIKRYKIKSGEELKNLFEVSDENRGTYKPTQNGFGQTDDSPINSSSLDLDDHRVRDMDLSDDADDDDDDDDEHWDD